MRIDVEISGDPPPPDATGRSTGNTWDTEIDEDGAFVREPTEFRNRISAKPGGDFQPDKGGYHLYVSYACPWAHRTLIARNLKGLE